MLLERPKMNKNTIAKVLDILKTTFLMYYHSHLFRSTKSSIVASKFLEKTYPVYLFIYSHIINNKTELS